ncbi:hypothetical protein IW146_005511 [Coemansia sp. RSA 922]|nr:hypothetical protein GGH13_004102 [Coemansia sp. S155-1]KAJ2111222.1 hypothetical protein IW146_005511 [Coemansia sp. RSA 922]KAJ2346353.1 hypothetical protein GGH92_003642 [Coemansia sp. RSA 2673]
MSPSVTSESSTIKIVVAGGNYAGLNAMQHLYSSLLANDPKTAAAAANARPNVEITLIDRRDGFIHCIGLTRGLTEPEFGADLWVEYSTVSWLQHPSIRIVSGTVAEITADKVLLSNGDSYSFDYLLIALGLSRFAPIGLRSSTKAKYIEEIAESHAQILAAQSVAVVGGGAVGLELAADIKSDFPEKQVTLIHSRALPVPGPFKDEFRHMVVDIMQEIGVDLVLGERVVAQTPESADMSYDRTKHSPMPERVGTMSSNAELALASGRAINADLAIRCLGTLNKRDLLRLPLAADIFGDDGIAVKDTMQIDSEHYPNIYACGDICSRALVKLAGVGMYGAYIAARNISRSVLAIGKLEDGDRYPSQLMLLLGKDHFALQLGDEIWEKERTREHVHKDMGLLKCVEVMSLHKEPEYVSLD